VSRLYELCTQKFTSFVQVVYSNTVYLYMKRVFPVSGKEIWNFLSIIFYLETFSGFVRVLKLGGDV
jgi:hypothetical protein